MSLWKPQASIWSLPFVVYLYLNFAPSPSGKPRYRAAIALQTCSHWYDYNDSTWLTAESLAQIYHDPCRWIRDQLLAPRNWPKSSIGSAMINHKMEIAAHNEQLFSNKRCLLAREGAKTPWGGEIPGAPNWSQVHLHWSMINLRVWSGRKLRTFRLANTNVLASRD